MKANVNMEIKVTYPDGTMLKLKATEHEDLPTFLSRLTGMMGFEPKVIGKKMAAMTVGRYNQFKYEMNIINSRLGGK
jgi:hypothetical protein